MCSLSSQRCANNVSPRPCQYDAANCSPASTTIRAKVELAELRARPSAVAWRDAALNRLTAEIDVTEGIDLSKRLLDADPLDEAALRAHMSWLARSGQSARARQALSRVCGRLADDLGLAPGVELRALHDSLGMPISPPRLRRHLPRPSNSMPTSLAAPSSCVASPRCWRRMTADCCA